MFYSVNLLGFSFCVFGRVCTVYFVPSLWWNMYYLFLFALSKNVNVHSPLCSCDADSMSGKLLQCMFAEWVMTTLC